MKKILYLLLLLPVLLMGCKKGTTDEPEAVKLSVDPSSIISPSVGADYSLTLTAPEAWTATCADSWVKVNPTSGNAGTVEVSVKIAADKSSTEASSKIVFKSGDQTLEVPVKRLAKDPARLIIASETEIQTPKDGGVYSIKVESNIKWQIASNASWAKIEGQATKRDNAIISVTVDQATTPEETVATLTVTPLEGTGVEKQTLTITRGASDATSMTIDKNQIDAPSDGGSYSITVNTTAQWRATKSWDADWITLSDNEKTGSGSFTVKVDAATSSNELSTVITVEEVRSDYYKPVQLNVLVTRKGKANAELSVDPTSISSPAEGGDFKVTIKSNYAWTASLAGTKIFSTSISKGDGNATMVVSIKPTTTSKEETGIIIIRSSYGDAQQIIHIHRAAYVAPEPEPKPTPKPASLYDPKPFSVSNTKKVYFSKGNLQYQASTNSWRFAEHQYDYVGDDKSTGNVFENDVKCSNTKISKTYNGWIDLFGWGTGSNPVLSTDKAEDYRAYVDWGSNTIDGANDWYTLNYAQWKYLLETRDNAEKLKGIGTVYGVKGYILLPDDWVSSSELNFTPQATSWTINDYTSQWLYFESKGAVFLPYAGLRKGTFVDPAAGQYWTSTFTEDSEKVAGVFYFGTNYAKIGVLYRYNGASVRLVQDVE